MDPLQEEYFMVNHQSGIPFWFWWLMPSPWQPGPWNPGPWNPGPRPPWQPGPRPPWQPGPRPPRW